jgi:lysophospholipase L1-like esterase
MLQKKQGQFKQVDAAIGGTGSELGAYRFEEHVLKYKPDLLFIEFAVNDNGAVWSIPDPTRNGAPQRTVWNLISRARAQNPDVAIVLPISTVREYLKGRSPHAVRMKKAREVFLRIAAKHRVPFVDVADAYYRADLPEGIERDRLFDGPDVIGNVVHPSALGHRVYAEAVLQRVRELLAGKAVSWPDLPKYADVPVYPVAPRIVPPEKVKPAAGWKVEPASADALRFPSQRERSVLMPSMGAQRLRCAFRGTGLMLWLHYGPRTLGRIHVHLDGKLTVKACTDPERGERTLRRFLSVARELDPKKEHVLEIEIPEKQPEKPGKPFKLQILGICIDGGPGAAAGK